MKSKLSVLAGLLALTACSGETPDSVSPQEGITDGSTTDQYVVMDDSLQQFKDDFNAAAGKVRLVFISGPTCGICLRGMADLNDAFIAAAQNDDRLQTFVIHVPTLGAKEKHVADSIPLLNGPNIRHYWEDSGIIGIHYRDAMDVPMYVWDFWAIYGPEKRWDGTLPPLPDYFEHQLGSTTGRRTGFPRELLLDAERFAGKAATFLAQLPQSAIPESRVSELAAAQLADGTVIPVVAQPRGVPIMQHIQGRGGYSNLKRIQRIGKHGKIRIGGKWLPLAIDSTRAGLIKRVIGSESEQSVGERNESGLVNIDTKGQRGLPAELENLLLTSFDFDGPLVEWPDKGHQPKLLRMEKIGNVLTWVLDFVHSDGQHWQLFIDSHGGGVIKANLLDENDGIRYGILQSDYRETSGFTFPHRIEYLDANGTVLAVEAIDKVVVMTDEANIAAKSASH